MDERIKELVDTTREKYGLTEYYLQNWDINRSTTIFNETVYTLSMEWFPNSMKGWEDEEHNPEGTASIEINIHSRNVKSVIFVGGISYADGMTFDLTKKSEIINWMEKETELTYGKQFTFCEEKEREIRFKECIDEIAVSPSGFIELKVDEKGKLTFFSVFGQFPNDRLIKREQYALDVEQIEEELKNEQVKLVEFPVIKERKIVPAYALGELYIKNDYSGTLSFDLFLDDSRLELDKVIEWDTPIGKRFSRKEMSWFEDISPEQAFQCEPHPNLMPILDQEVQRCVDAVRDFLSHEYVNDSGDWVLKSLHREKGYIHAILNKRVQQERVFRRKLMIIIDAKMYEVINYMDNQFLMDMYKDFKGTEEINITKKEAYDKLNGIIELTPCYVYDSENSYYVLCGKLDCHFAVKASNGEVVALSEL